MKSPSYSNPFEAENPYAWNQNQNPELPPDDPGGRWDDPVATPSNIPCAPGYEKKLNAAGTAYECVKAGESGGGCTDEDGRPGAAGTVSTNLDATGVKQNWKWCVTPEELARRQGLNGGGGGGGSSSGGGSGGGSGSTQPFKPQSKPYEFEPWTPPTPTPFAQDLQKQLSEFLNGWNTDVPYTDPVVSNMKTNAFLATKGRTAQEKRAVEADAIRRGVFRSTGTDRRLDARSNAADAAYAGAERGIENTATIGNYEARTQNRLAALDRAQRHVDSEREYLMASEMNHFARQEGLAKLALAYYSLEQQRWELTQQLNSGKYQFDKNFDYNSSWNKTLLEWEILNGVTA